MACSALVPTPLGTVLLDFDAEQRLVGVQYHPTEAPHLPAHLSANVRWIDEFFSGQSVPPTALPHAFTGGTALQRAVWAEIGHIRRGETITYSELARRVGHPRAVRAVASACGKNPLPLLYPCHRVVGIRGSLGGFGWGLEAKRYLLALEGVGA